MENATKALIIAAAVLVTILVIALGVGIVKKGDAGNQASNVSAQLDAAGSAAIGSLQSALSN